ARRPRPAPSRGCLPFQGGRPARVGEELRDARELEEALARVKQLQGLLPICSYCKKVRDDQNYWQQVEIYIEGHSDAQFTHGICPECREKYVEPELERLREIRRTGEAAP
ncbi:MAG: hypothetical protein HYS77_10050, partial [Candidatus Rokubacteria bacterium]|nr:hypothetical protein [Candidatus Rokubacteria bacterium]